MRGGRSVWRIDSDPVVVLVFEASRVRQAAFDQVPAEWARELYLPKRDAGQAQ